MIPAMKRFHIVAGLSLAVMVMETAAISSGILPELAQLLEEKDQKAIESSVGQIEEALRPIYMSMPHNEHGKVGVSVVRYVLHRFFMQRGWSVLGLEPAGQGWSSGSPTEILRVGLPSQAVELFDARLNAEGLDLSEAAALAAAFKTVIRREMLERLETVYRFHRLEQSGTIGQEEADRVLNTYTASYVVGKNISALSLWEIGQLENRAGREYSNLPQVQELARNTKKSLLGEAALSFSDMARVTEELGERFGLAEDNAECRPRKRDLVELEHRGSGRVRLAEFYRAALHGGKWHFGESSAYLRQLGALDETDPADLQVIIPNYVNSKSNCIDSSRYHSVCCINECDALLGQLESQIGHPSATPSEIAPLVAAMGSDTVSGNRALPASLMRRLEEVAAGNDGRIPLHGRLFAQWMHHAYPRECPFPHISGTTSPVRVQDWAAEEGNEVVASQEEMKQHIETPRDQQRQSSPDEADDEGECAPWMEEEEILAPHAPSAVARQRLGRGSVPVMWWIISAVALLMAFGTGAVHLAAPKSEGGASRNRVDDKMADLAIVYNV